MKLQDAPTGNCPGCGSRTLTLATETVHTSYQPMTFDSGRWMPAGTATTEQTTNSPVRFFCPSCGTYFKLPEELE